MLDVLIISARTYNSVLYKFKLSLAVALNE